MNEPKVRGDGINFSFDYTPSGLYAEKNRDYGCQSLRYHRYNQEEEGYNGVRAVDVLLTVEAYLSNPFCPVPENKDIGKILANIREAIELLEPEVNP